MNDSKETILREEYNCWRIAGADRLTFLVDAASYHEAFMEAVGSAKRSLYIAAWDIDSRLALRSRASAAVDSLTLGRFLKQKTAESPDLNTYILAWDFLMLYLRKWKWLSILNLGWRTHRRVHFHLDDHHPMWASHHQKLVVIDDRIAFCGSVDLTKNRWDTPEHLVEDKRRTNPDGSRYDPYHELQMLVDGEAAAWLGELFRNRWFTATGKRLSPPDAGKGDPWPASVAPDMTGARVGIARTQPAFQDQSEVRETEALFRTAISSAEHWLYVENQYLTSAAIVQALAESLDRSKGPEMLLVLPRQSSGWLEQGVMDAIRSRLLDYLFEKDRHGRLGVYYPVTGNPAKPVYVHSKLMIADDRLAVVSSANLSNRSMGLDTECSLAVVAQANRHREALAMLRNRLLAEHLGSDSQAILRFLLETGSLLAVASRLGTPGRHLEKIDHREALSLDGLKFVQDVDLLDPEKPMQFDRLVDDFARDADPSSGRLGTIKIAVVIVLLLGMAAAWRWTPLEEWLNLNRLAAWGALLDNDLARALTAVTLYVAGSFVMIPVMLLVGATGLVFPPLAAALVALSGCVCSAAVSYALGARLGRDTIRRLGGKRLSRLNRRLARRGILAVAMIRNLPVAPFTMVNLLAGASRIRFTDYIIGTAVGMLPGIVVLTAFADRLLAAVRNPNWTNIAAAVGILMVLGLGFWWLQRRFFGRKRG